MQCNEIIYQLMRSMQSDYLSMFWITSLPSLSKATQRELHVDHVFLNILLFFKGSWFRTVSFPDTSPCYLFDKCSISINSGMTERRWNLFDEFIYFKIKWNLFDKTPFWRHKQTYTLAQITFYKGFSSSSWFGFTTEV